MAIIVQGSRVRVGKKTYNPGETIDGLAKKEEQRLVALGVCAPVAAEASSTKTISDNDGPNTDTPSENANSDDSGPNTDHPAV